MTLYSFGGAYPAPLPFRIRLSDGRTRTDPSSFTAGEIADAGYVAAPDAPSSTPASQVLAWIGSAWSVGVRPIAERKAEMIQAAKAECAAAIAAGFTHGGHVYQIDDQSQVHMTAVMADFNAGPTDAHGGFWRSAANVNVAMDGPTCVAFLQSAKDYKMNVIRAMWTKIQNIQTAADHAALDAL